jgi:hypothetical protein
MQEPEKKTGGHPPQLQSLRQNTPPTRTTTYREISTSYLDIPSLLNTRSQDHHNDPASVVISTEHKPSGAVKTAEGCVKTLPLKASIPNLFSRDTHLQPALSNIDVTTLLSAPKNDQAFDVKPRPSCSSEGTAQAPVKTSHSASELPAMSTCLHNSTLRYTSPNSMSCVETERAPQNSTPKSEGSSSGRTVHQEDAIQSQGLPEGPYNNAFTQRQDGSHSSIPGTLGQTSTSDPILFRIDTCDGSFDIPVDVHQASKLVGEKRKRNAGASARSRQRRKEENDTTNIDELNQQVRNLQKRVKLVEEERDLYRDAWNAWNRYRV